MDFLGLGRTSTPLDFEKIENYSDSARVDFDASDESKKRLVVKSGFLSRLGYSVWVTICPNQARERSEAVKVQLKEEIKDHCSKRGISYSEKNFSVGENEKHELLHPGSMKSLKFICSKIQNEETVTEEINESDPLSKEELLELQEKAIRNNGLGCFKQEVLMSVFLTPSGDYSSVTIDPLKKIERSSDVHQRLQEKANGSAIESRDKKNKAMQQIVPDEKLYHLLSDYERLKAEAIISKCQALKKAAVDPVSGLNRRAQRILNKPLSELKADSVAASIKNPESSLIPKEERLKARDVIQEAAALFEKNLEKLPETQQKLFRPILRTFAKEVLQVLTDSRNQLIAPALKDEYLVKIATFNKTLALLLKKKPDASFKEVALLCSLFTASLRDPKSFKDRIEEEESLKDYL